MQDGEIVIWDEASQTFIGSGIVLNRATRMLDLNGNSFRTIIERDENGSRPAAPMIAREGAEVLHLKRLKAISNCAIKLTIDGDGSGGEEEQVVPETSMWLGMCSPGQVGVAFSGNLNKKDDRLWEVRGGPNYGIEGLNTQTDEPPGMRYVQVPGAYNQAQTWFPVGTTIMVSSPSNHNANSKQTIRIATNGGYEVGGSGEALSGDWRCRGKTGTGIYLFQKVK